MLSLYCSIGKASVFAELDSSVHVVGREDLAANDREKRELFLIAFLYQCEGLCTKKANLTTDAHG
jgi:hypothetical protein